MRIHVKIIPGSKTKSIENLGQDLLGNNFYKIKLTQKPVDGEANRALIENLSDYFDVPKRSIKIISGHTSRDKIIEIEGI